ncbi:MAG: hypothetical protein NC092_01215 [Butyrivibrio sp.]|nr:hypothetical protein [Muribaculum sp.]MCM1551292.1 hypothetical protein [Butyrivibrio sp.]
MGVFIGISCIVAIVVNFYIATEFYQIAEMKGYPEGKYLWISFLFPLYGHLLVIALPDKSQREAITEDSAAKQTTSFERDELPDL